FAQGAVSGSRARLSKPIPFEAGDEVFDAAAQMVSEAPGLVELFLEAIGKGLAGKVARVLIKRIGPVKGEQPLEEVLLPGLRVAAELLFHQKCEFCAGG